MKTLSMLVVGMVLGAAANAAQVAAEEPAVATITVTAKRPHSSVAAAESAPPRAAIEIAAPLLTDMPEMEIDSHMTLIDAAAAPAVAHVTL